MNKATLTEAVILIASGALAGGLAKQLADHNVSTAAIVAVIVFTLTTGLYLAAQIGQGMRTSYFACPTKGCTVSIRAKNTSPTELDQLRVLATDHTKHGSTR
jgi:hypothetical protein